MPSKMSEPELPLIGGEQPRIFIIVIDDEFYGLDAKLIANVALQAGIPSDPGERERLMKNTSRSAAFPTFMTMRQGSPLLSKELGSASNSHVTQPSILNWCPTAISRVEHPGEVPRV